MLKYLPLLLTAHLGAFTLESPTFKDRGEIPGEFGCDHDIVSPELSWRDPPSNTVVYALVIKDLNLNRVHGKLYNIPRETTHLSEGSVPFTPFCPPPGKNHRYEFSLYALDKEITDPREIVQHTLKVAKLTGYYKTVPKPS